MAAKIKFGVLGYSRVAWKDMLPALLDSEHAVLGMLGSRDPEKAKEASAKHGAAAWGSYEDVVASSDLDVVYVSLPNTLHEEWSIKALRAGKHVICEKPAALTYAAAKRMVQAARDNKVRLLEGLMFRYHPQHRQVKEFISNGTLGELVRFDACFGFPMPDRNNNLRNKELGGGALNYVAPYPICASRMILGEEPLDVFCKMELDPESGVDARADMLLGYGGGKVAHASTLFGAYFQSTYSVLGSKAGIRMGRAYAVPRNMGTKIFLDANDATQEIAVAPVDQFRLMLDDFCETIAGRKEPEHDYESDLLAQARVLEAARLSAAENRLVNISEIN